MMVWSEIKELKWVGFLRFTKLLGLKMGYGPNFVAVSWCHRTGIFKFAHFSGDKHFKHNFLVVRW
jgi:hypothetical protein